MHKLLKIFIYSCCVLMLAATTAMAFGEIRYPDRPLNLRNGRSPKASWVGSLHPGQKVRVAYLKDGWYAVFEPNETRNSESAAVGFASGKYLLKKQTRVEPKEWGELVYAMRNLNVRSKPSRRAPQVEMLKTDEHVRIDFPEDDWTMVFPATATIRSKLNAIGYSSSKYFKPATKQSLVKPDPTPKPAATSEANGKGQVSGSVAPPPAPEVAESGSWGRVVTIERKVNLRKERTSGSRYVRTLKPGEKVRVDYLKSGWYAVFRENEPLRQENRAMGYALESLIDGDHEDVVTTAATPVSVSTPAPKMAQESTGGVKKTMVIDRSKFQESKRPDPTPDKTAHGYEYRLLEKSETKRFGETWITLKVFLSTTKLPGSEALEDFAKTLWQKNKRANRMLAVLIYLPGMDTEDLAYGVVQFSDEKMLELWVRKTTLFGTDFL